MVYSEGRRLKVGYRFRPTMALLRSLIYDYQKLSPTPFTTLEPLGSAYARLPADRAFISPSARRSISSHRAGLIAEPSVTDLILGFHRTP